MVCYTLCVSDLGSRQRGPMGLGGAGGLASLQRTDKARRLAPVCVEGRGIAPPIQSVVGTGVAPPSLGPSRVGMRPRRPLQDVREVTEVGELRTKHFLLLRVPGRACPPWHRGTAAGRREVGRACTCPSPAGET
jgi:hypothetical protein